MTEYTKKHYNLTREELLDIIVKRTKELGRTPKRTEIKEYCSILKVFGSYKEALKILGIERNVYKGISKEDLITIIQNKAKELGRNPKTTEINEYSTILRKFGSYDKALEEAGLCPEHIYNRSNKELLGIIVDKYIELGRSPYAKEIKESKTIIRRFGTWNKALNEAGLTINKIGNYTRREVMDIVYKKAYELQRTPTVEDCNSINKAVRYYFGSWNNLIAELGLDINHYCTKIKDTTEELMNKYISLSNRLGKLANTYEIREFIGISFIVYRKRVGRLSDVQEYAIKSGKLNFDYGNKTCNRKKVYSLSQIDNSLKTLREANEKKPFKTKREVADFCRNNGLPSLSFLIIEKKVSSYKDLF